MMLCAMLILQAHFVAEATQAVLLITAGSFFAALGGPVALAVTIDCGGRHPMKIFKHFRSREPNLQALLRHSGLM